VTLWPRLLGYHSNFLMPETISIPSTPPRLERTVTPGSFLLFGSILLAVFVFVFWTFIERQVRFAIEQQADWGHTLVIPFIAGWFVWMSRRQILAEPFRPSVTGLVLVVLGIAWFSLVSLGPVWARHHNFQGMGVGLVIAGLVLAFCGWHAMRWLWFPVAYLVIFSQTISPVLLEIVTFRLQGIATVGAEFGLSIIGFDVSRDGHTINIFDNGRNVPVNVAEACSGMRMLVAFLALGVAMAWGGLAATWQRVLLVIMAVPTAIFINILRVMTLGILATYDSGFAAGDFHTMIGMLWLVPAFFVYLGIMWVLKHIVVDEPDELSEPDVETLRPIRFGGKITGIFVASLVLLIGGGLAFQSAAAWLNVHLRTEAVHLRQPLTLIPSSIDQWQMLHDTQLDSATLEQLGTKSYISRVYGNRDRPQDPVLQFHVAYYTGQADSVPHVPDRCMEAAGKVQASPAPENLPIEQVSSDWIWSGANRIDDLVVPTIALADPLTDVVLDVHLPVGDQLFRHIEFSDPANPGVRIHAGYFFVANGRWRATPGGVKLAAFTGGDKHAYYCKVQLVAAGDEYYDTDAFLKQSEAFLTPMLPQIMRLVPDWPEIQAAEVASMETD
jgi:exosortase